VTVSRPRATLLTYHRVSLRGVEPDEGDYALPSPLFEEQMRLLAREGWPVVPLSLLPEGGFPDRSVVITFDDGCETDATVALPLLRGLGFPAAFFVNPARVGQAGRLSWPDIERLAEAGMRIGSHGLDHTLLDGLSRGEVERQLAVSKQILEQRLGIEIDALSLPGGTGGRPAVGIAHQVGYRLVLGSEPGRAREGRLPALLPRHAVRCGDGVPRFRAAVEMRAGFLLEERVRYHAKRALRAILGQHRYVKLRENRLPRPSQGDLG
jgi:peptidoglycan/xylan/chitin deacetylase (PgdA/CDA1 family)